MKLLLTILILPFLVGCDLSKDEVDPLDEELVTPEEKEALDEYTDGDFRKG